MSERARNSFFGFIGRSEIWNSNFADDWLHVFYAHIAVSIDAYSILYFKQKISIKS